MWKLWAMHNCCRTVHFFYYFLWFLVATTKTLYWSIIYWCLNFNPINHRLWTLWLSWGLLHPPLTPPDFFVLWVFDETTWKLYIMDRVIGLSPNKVKVVAKFPHTLKVPHSVARYIPEFWPDVLYIFNIWKSSHFQ